MLGFVIIVRRIYLHLPEGNKMEPTLIHISMRREAWLSLEGEQQTTPLPLLEEQRELDNMEAFVL